MLLLIPIGSAAAQPSTNYVMQRSVITSGGLANSASYSVTSVIGQPVTDVMNNTSYQVSGGFSHMPQQASQIDHQLWLPVIVK